MGPPMSDPAPSLFPGLDAPAGPVSAEPGAQTPATARTTTPGSAERTAVPGTDGSPSATLGDGAVIDLTGQVALVTGGNGGIGLGMAEGLVLAGAAVAICGRNTDKLDAAVEHLHRLRPDAQVEAFRCDVAVESEVADVVGFTVDRFGRLDACVANAGISGDAAILDLSLDEWRRVLSVNLDGAFVTLREAARQMVAQGEGGALVAVSSTSSEHGAPRNAHYAVSKAGVLALVRSMAVALARERIRANSLVPGWTLTELTAAGYEYDKFRDATIRAHAGAPVGSARGLPHRRSVPVRQAQRLPHRRRGHLGRRLHRLLNRSRPTDPLERSRKIAQTVPKNGTLCGFRFAVSRDRPGER